jgi:hypothetical protein
MYEFDYYRFHRQRRSLQVTGYVLFVLGIVTIMDMAWTVPIPLTGTKAIIGGLILIGLGTAALYNGYKLPINEALDLIHRRGQGITASEIVHEMRVDKGTADQIMQVLLRKGFVRSSRSGGTTEESFEPTR